MIEKIFNLEHKNYFELIILYHEWRFIPFINNAIEKYILQAYLNGYEDIDKLESFDTNYELLRMSLYDENVILTHYSILSKYDKIMETRE